MADDESDPTPGVHLLRSGDAVLVLLAPGVEFDEYEWSSANFGYFGGVTFHFVHGVVGAAVRKR